MISVNYDRYREYLKIEKSDNGILTIALNNPDQLNSSTEPMHWSLSRIWEDVDADNDVRVVIFTAVGDRAFSAGGNFNKLEEMAGDYERWDRTGREGKRIIYGMLQCDKPIITRLNGHAIGFGCSIAMAGDIIIGVETARIGDPHVQIGLVCGDGGALLWPAQIGYARAKEMLFTGNVLTMKEAAAIGLINYAVPAAELDAKVSEIVTKILSGSPRAIQMTKNAINLPLRQQALATLELGMMNEICSGQSADHREAVRAMIEKRAPKFTGK